MSIPTSLANGYMHGNVQVPFFEGSVLRSVDPIPLNIPFAALSTTTTYARPVVVPSLSIESNPIHNDISDAFFYGGFSIEVVFTSLAAGAATGLKFQVAASSHIDPPVVMVPGNFVNVSYLIL